ncbi:transmembrane and TPR repeat-containing protein [Geobacter sp. OR-1]|uniref:tetratricopeptide repeat protein n=1 Tax=Geobacter sp. OR-1 TaxID=1266765 RepID=UPI0005423D22|nr:tetratricopeptide repeat protein [Geobacter sp. OR-1]GAM10549.1 transmembrane and TPR repeat-containing protein [Geobacter sp. OR-1]
MNREKYRVITIALLVAAVCFIVYLRALSCGFVNLDEPEYLLDNTAIRTMDKDFWYWAFATVSLNFWVPLLWLSFAIDYQIWGLDPFGFHLTNNILHALNAGLIVFVCDKMFKNRWSVSERFSRSRFLYPLLLLIAGLLFAVHPARVESVAWVTERKDVLNGFFTMGFIYFYLCYQEKKEAGLGNGAVWRAYLISLGLFLLSLMAKPSSILIPVALLLIDWYPLERFRKGNVIRLVTEKLPFLVLSVPIVLASMLLRAQQGGYNTFSDFPLFARFVAAGNSVVEYYRMMLWPVGILPYYNLPRAIPELYLVKTILLILFLCYSVYLGRKIPWFTAAVFTFTITLFPALHFFADGYQLILAARYTYLASIFPSIIVAALVVKAYQRGVDAWPSYGRYVAATLVVAVFSCYVATTYRLIGDWKNSGAMWTKVIERLPFDKAYFFRGWYYSDIGNYEAAIDDYTTCLSQASPQTIPALYNIHSYRGYALMKAGYYNDAVDDFSTAIAMAPHPQFYYFRGMTYKAMGNAVAAAADLARADGEAGRLYWVD